MFPAVMMITHTWIIDDDAGRLNKEHNVRWCRDVLQFQEFYSYWQKKMSHMMAENICV